MIDGIPLRMWYVSQPFDIVCVRDRAVPEDMDEDDFMRERPLLAVDFGHAVWIEWYKPDDKERSDTELSRQSESSPATIMATDESTVNDDDLDDDASIVVEVNGVPPALPHDEPLIHGHGREGMEQRMMFSTFPTVEIDACGRDVKSSSSEAVVRELDLPDELDLTKVETINIDQSQGAIFMSVQGGQIYVVYYE
jgi:hypothetical protein